MPVVSKALQIGDYAFTAVAVVCLLVAAFSWVEALVVIQTSYAYGEALVWTLLTLVAFIPSLAIDWVQNRGA